MKISYHKFHKTVQNIYLDSTLLSECFKILVPKVVEEVEKVLYHSSAQQYFSHTNIVRCKFLNEEKTRQIKPETTTFISEAFKALACG